MESERLIFRKIVKTDFDRFYKLHSDSILTQNSYNPIDFDSAMTVFDNLLKHWDENNFGTFAISTKIISTKIIGFGGIYYRDIPEIGNALNLGLAFDKHFWGFGYATETAKASINFIREKLGTNSIFAMTGKQNFKAKNVLEKCGFKLILELESGELIFKLHMF